MLRQLGEIRAEQCSALRLNGGCSFTSTALARGTERDCAESQSQRFRHNATQLDDSMRRGILTLPRLVCDTARAPNLWTAETRLRFSFTTESSRSVESHPPCSQSGVMPPQSKAGHVALMECPNTLVRSSQRSRLNWCERRGHYAFNPGTLLSWRIPFCDSLRVGRCDPH